MHVQLSAVTVKGMSHKSSVISAHPVRPSCMPHQHFQGHNVSIPFGALSAFRIPLWSKAGVCFTGEANNSPDPLTPFTGRGAKAPCSTLHRFLKEVNCSKLNPTCRVWFSCLYTGMKCRLGRCIITAGKYDTGPSTEVCPSEQQLEAT